MRGANDRPAMPEPIELDAFGPDARLHHVGLAVQSIHTVEPDAEIWTDTVQKVGAAFIDLNGVTVELLEPSGEDSPIARGVREGSKLVHLCYEVPDLEEALAHGRSAGFHKISAAASTPTFGDRRIVWVFSRHYGLVELLEGE